MTAPRAPKPGSKQQQQQQQQTTPTSRITALTLVPNEQSIVFAGFESGTIHRLRRNAPKGEAPLVVLEGHTGPITGLSAPATGDDVTSCSLDGTIKIWQSTLQAPEGGAKKRCLRTINVGQPIRSFMPSPAGDGTFYCGTSSGSIIRVEGSHAVDELVGGHVEPVTAISMAESGALLSASIDGSVVGWDLSTRAPAFVFKGHNGAVRAAAVAGSNLYTVGSDEALCCFAVPQDFTPPMPADGSNPDEQYNNADEDHDGAAAAVAGDDDDDENGNTQQDTAEGTAVMGASATVAPGEQHEQPQEHHDENLAKISWVIKPSATVHLPWLPSSIAIVGSYAVIGTAARLVACVNIRALNNKITEYGNRVETLLVQAERKLRKLAAEKKKRVQKAARRQIREFKQAHGGGGSGDAGGDYGDEQDEEPQYDEDGNEISAGGAASGDGVDHSAEIEEFEREQLQAVQDKAQEIDNDVVAQVSRFGRLRSQFFVQSAANFITSAMCDIVPGICGDSVFCVVGEGARLYVASGAAVEALTLRPKVRAV